MELLNDFKVRQDSRLERFLSYVNGGKAARNGRGMLTVSNHTSVLDDPMLQAALVGFRPAWNSENHRWGVCKKSICFKTPFHAAFTGAGKVIPVVVGDGLEQPLFKASARKLADGDWVHIFPEGACNQTGRVGVGTLRKKMEGYVVTRDEDLAEKIGRLKWGAGKLVARVAFGESREPPLIVPYYHVGMQDVMPQRNLPDDNALKHVAPRVGKRVRVVVGDPVDVSDLIAEYEKKHGPRRLASAVVDSVTNTERFQGWEGSTAPELELYSAITRRIQHALEALENEHRVNPVL